MHVLILGTRGIPSSHGGFETFAQDLALYLRAQNHLVTIYCHRTSPKEIEIDYWNGIRRIHIAAPNSPFGTILYDWISARHTLSEEGVILTLGYNTAIFSAIYRIKNLPSIMNMDGVEWKRAKWSKIARCWLWLNERAGSCLSNHLVADHPAIANHLSRHTNPNKISVIPYGADAVEFAPNEPIHQFGLTSKGYYIMIARPEPENSVLEIVEGFSKIRRGSPLIVLGFFTPDKNPYHRRVMQAAGPDIRFVGAIYDRNTVQALRFHARAYFHGHQIGGTNPSLVESLAAGNAILAHDNCFNRWVAGAGARYFTSSDELDALLRELEDHPEVFRFMEDQSRSRHRERFTQQINLPAYEELLLRFSVDSKQASDSVNPSASNAANSRKPSLEPIERPVPAEEITHLSALSDTGQ